jgi:hypothetical protein
MQLFLKILHMFLKILSNSGDGLIADPGMVELRVGLGMHSSVGSGLLLQCRVEGFLVDLGSEPFFVSISV